MLALVAAILIAGSPPALEAQNDVQMVRTLVIKDNQVLIDGQPVSSDQLPLNVDLDGLSVTYSFIGVQSPVVTIGDQLYAVEKDHLQPIESRAEYQSFVTQQQRQTQNENNEAQDARGWIVDSKRGEYYNFQGERLEADEAVPRILSEANTLYLEDLQKQNQVLYSRLSHEQELERQAEYLARAARLADSSDEQQKHREALRQKLDEIFELKQQNRRDEIAQFEQELEQLKQRVERRAQLKDEIIERRVQRLVGEGP
jgi:hypothetical protein